MALPFFNRKRSLSQLLTKRISHLASFPPPLPEARPVSPTQISLKLPEICFYVQEKAKTAPFPKMNYSLRVILQVDLLKQPWCSHSREPKSTSVTLFCLFVLLLPSTIYSKEPYGLRQRLFQN